MANNIKTNSKSRPLEKVIGRVQTELLGKGISIIRASLSNKEVCGMGVVWSRGCTGANHSNDTLHYIGKGFEYSTTPSQGDTFTGVQNSLGKLEP